MPISVVIYLDTNVLYAKDVKQLIAQSAQRIISRDLPPDHLVAKYCVSDVVVRERKFQILTQSRLMYRDVRRLDNIAPGLTWPSETTLVEAINANFENLLRDLNVEVVTLDLTAVDWRELVDSALDRRPPFEEGPLEGEDKTALKEKGFRDALMLAAFDQLRKSLAQAELSVLAIVTGDKRAAMAVDLLQDPKVKRFADVAELETFINQTIADITNQQIEQLEAAVQTLISIDDSGLPEFLKVVKRELLQKFNELLNEVVQPYSKRETDSFGWERPVFQQRDGNLISWTMTVTSQSSLFLTQYTFMYGGSNSDTFQLTSGSKYSQDGLQSLRGSGVLPFYQPDIVTRPSCYRKESFLVTFTTTANEALDTLAQPVISQIVHLGTELSERLF